MLHVPVATASAVGAMHRRHSLGSEDAVRWSTGDRGTVLAVADGHSDPRCVRADRGARFAVQAAVELAAPDAPAAAEHLVDQWLALVTADAHQDPLLPDDTMPLSYGTTLIACWITDAGLRLLQIGDGVAVVATEAGTIRPLPPGAHEGTTQTDSLASGSAATTARTALLPVPTAPLVVCLATDGVDTAYPDRRGLVRAVDELRTLAVVQGPASAAARLDPWVRQAAEVSGDDATVALAIVMPEGSR